MSTFLTILLFNLIPFFHPHLHKGAPERIVEGAYPDLVCMDGGNLSDTGESYFFLSSLVLTYQKSGTNNVLPNIPDSTKPIIKRKKAKDSYTYKVVKIKEPLRIDSDWRKPEWKKIRPIKLKNYMGRIPSFRPKAEAKMMYDEENVYVIFRVKDRYVSSLVQEYNGNVSGDACVEFFFAPDVTFPQRYFNLEINAGGTPLMFYIIPPYPIAKYIKLDSTEISQIEIAHSLPSVVDPEITEPVTWTIEYRIPLLILEKYSNVTKPDHGVVWKANFYKTGSRTSNPHWIAWSPVDYPKPNFHLPQYFGTLIFQ